MAILKSALAVTAVLGAVQSLAVLPANRTVSKPTLVVEKRWEETNCVSRNYDLNDYESARQTLDRWLYSGQWIDPQVESYQAWGSSQVYICNNENNYDIWINYEIFDYAMSILDNSCGVGVAGWTRDHRSTIDVSLGRDVYPWTECGFNVKT